MRRIERHERVVYGIEAKKEEYFRKMASDKEELPPESEALGGPRALDKIKEHRRAVLVTLCQISFKLWW